MFEGWSANKLSKYDIDLDTYDHSEIANRPAILVQCYSNHKSPFLTVIHLWDKFADYVLSSRHNPINISLGEPGMDNKTVAVESSARCTIGFGSPKRKLESDAFTMDALVKTHIDLCKKERKPASQ